MIREMTDEQVRKFFRKNFFDCMKDVEYGPGVDLANNEDRHPEKRFQNCNMNISVYIRILTILGFRMKTMNLTSWSSAVGSMMKSYRH